MKKYLVLTSIFALAACGGGGGSGDFGGHAAHPTTPGNPAIHMQGFSGGTTVNANNTSVTNMSSYTVDYGTDEDTTKSLMIQYVEDHLNGGLRGGLNRAASSRNRDVEVTAENFALADAAITEMKQVLYDMVGKPNDNALKTYVTRYRYAVVNALRLQDKNVTNETSIDGLVAAFNELKSDNSWTADNIMAALDAFDANEFEITKHKMDDVRLKDTGEEGFFKFKLDDTGKIQSVALMEDPVAEYGSSWADTRIIIGNNGYATSADPDITYGLNPFGADYLTDKAGTLVRNGTGAEFSNTVCYYQFRLGKYNEGDNPLTLQSGHELSTILQPDDFKNIEITSETALTPEEAKAKLIQYIIEKVNKKIHNQNGGSDVQVDLDDAIEVVNWYIDLINETITNSAVTDAFQGNINQIATMHGMGKEEGVKLKYSDFGYAKLRRTMAGQPEETNYLTYVGGYDQRRMDNTDLEHNTLESGATFTGTAIVAVEDHHKDKTGDDTIESTNMALYKDTSAVLQYDIVNAGTQAQHTLTMEHLKAVEGQVSTNSDWYTMVVSGTEGVDDMTVQFDSTGKTIDENYQFFVAGNDGTISRNEHESIAAGDQLVNTTGDTSMTVGMTDGTALDEHHRMNGSVTAQYYGQDNHNPTEATAGFWVDERWANDGNTIQHELSAYGAFGGQKD